jgi:hypothetical protein
MDCMAIRANEMRLISARQESERANERTECFDREMNAQSTSTSVITSPKTRLMSDDGELKRVCGGPLAHMHAGC